MNKGFTLIELLAVIVILAVILVITVPSISNLMNDTQMSAFESDTKLVLKTVKLKMLEDNTFDPTSVNETNINTLLKISNDNYKSLTIMKNSDELSIISVGKNKWDNLVATGTNTNMVVHEGLKLWLDASIVKSYPGTGTTWYDLSGNGKNGALINSPIFQQGYFIFNKINNYVTLPAVLPVGQKQYTMAGWWKARSATTSQVVYEQNSSTFINSKRSAILLASSGKWGFNGQSNDAHDQVPIRINQWVYGVITVDTNLASNPIKIYENGVLYWQGNTSGYASNLNLGDGMSYIGRKATQDGEYFDGYIASISVYNRILTANEIFQNYNADKIKFGL